MAYTQKFGLNRLSPLNFNHEKEEVENKEVFTPGIDVGKSIAKEVVKKTVPNSIISKILGFGGRRATMFAEIFLGSQKAYAPPKHNFKEVPESYHDKFDPNVKKLDKYQKQIFDIWRKKNPNKETSEYFKNMQRGPRHVLKQGK
tara:strand:- start:296 stop:727 length:432 start_codon:yes stop_codon:yes gene_type:complete